MKKVFQTLGIILALALLAAGCGTANTGAPAPAPAPAPAASGSGNTAANTTGQAKSLKLGIIQIVEHPALDGARQGFLDELKANGYTEGQNLTVDYQNAQGDMPTLNTIAKKLAAEKPDLILAIATPSAQAMAAATQDIPILITAVTDPVAAKLVNSNEKPGTNVTGTTDMYPVKAQLQLLQKLLPNAKRIGIIYNTGEVNSQVQAKIVKEAAGQLGLTIVEATVSNSSDVLQATQSLIGKVDALYGMGDNTVMSAIDAVLQVSNKNKIPMISADTSVMDKGPLASLGINYKNLGKQTADIALKIIKGAKPQDTPIEGAANFDTVINQTTATQFNVKIPDDIAKIATFVTTK